MKYKILIVDDEPDILEFMEYNMQKDGYEVQTANNGKLGLERAKSFKPHLVILDIMMPEMEGTEVCRQLRADTSFKDTLITFLTARSEEFSQVLGLDLGADDYITKPIRPRVLSSRVAALLRRHPATSEDENNIITIADLVINREKVSVQRAGEPIVLAKKEFKLLYLLASKPGKVFTRNEIFEKIWGDDVIVGNRTIDVHVRKLREKLIADYIKTVKGIGYKFDF